MDTLMKLWDVISCVIEPSNKEKDLTIILYHSERWPKPADFALMPVCKKSIEDQIIEGLQDGDTVEVLLQESELTLATTVTKCRSKEAIKKNWSQKAAQEQEKEMIVAVRNPQLGAQQRKYHACPGCGGT